MGAILIRPDRKFVMIFETFKIGYDEFPHHIIFFFDDFVVLFKKNFIDSTLCIND